MISILKAYREQRRLHEIEAALPETLYQASSLSTVMPLEEVIASLAASARGALAGEFRKTSNDIRLGMATDSALRRMAKRAKSADLERATNILVSGYITGADISKALAETADSASEMRALVRERAAAMTIEKWTLLFAGAFLVPLILGMMSSLTASLDVSGISMLGAGMGDAARAELMQHALLGSQIYIAIYAVLASVFVAFQENKTERALLYAPALTACSLALFSIAQGMRIL